MTISLAQHGIVPSIYIHFLSSPPPPPHHHTHPQIGEKFYPYSLDKQNLTFQELQGFFREDQQDEQVDDPSYLASLVWDFVRQPGRSRDARQPSLTLPEVRGDMRGDV